MAMSYTATGDFLELFNDVSYETETPYIVDPKTLPCEAKVLPPTVALNLCVLLIIICILAIPGNFLVGLVIGTSKQALTPSDVYLVHLTVADGLLAITLPFWATAMVRGWIFGDFMCKALSLITEANFYTSILFLTCISIDRYLVIVHASESFRNRQRMCSWIICAAVWAFGVALSLPALFHEIAPVPDSNMQRMICIEVFDIGRSSVWRLATRTFLHIFGFFLPLVVMVFCYGITIARLLLTRGFQKHRAMKVILSVVIAFLLCWTPYHLSMMADTVLRADLLPFDCTVRRSVSQAIDVTLSLALLHSCINPVLYAFVGEKFRRNMKLLLKRKVRLERMSGSRFSRSTSQTSENNGAFF